MGAETSLERCLTILSPVRLSQPRVVGVLSRSPNNHVANGKLLRVASNRILLEMILILRQCAFISRFILSFDLGAKVSRPC